MVVLMVVRVLGGGATGPGGTDAGGAAAGASPSASGLASASAAPSGGAPADPSTFLLATARPAPAVELTGPDGRPVSLAALRGEPVLVFFGYTHCPDVCPATIGRVGEAIDAFGGGARAIFVSVDPERDTVPWLAEFVKYMPAGFTAVTGTPAAIRATADDWGVRYARVEEADPDAYSMSHTADVFLVDADGELRATFPFGTEAATMTAVLRLVAATPVASPATPVATASPTAATPSPAGS